MLYFSLYSINGDVSLEKKKTPLHIEQEAWWAPEPVLTMWGEKKSLEPARFLNSYCPARSLDSIATTLYRLPSMQVIAYIFFYSHSRERFIVR